MRKRVGILAFVLASAAAASLSAQDKLSAQKLVDGVWATQTEKGANVGWFLLGDGVIAVDSGPDAATGKKVLDLIAETTSGKPVRALVLTHSHADHSGGARAFVAAGARVICQENVAGPVLSLVTQATTDPADPLAGKANLRPVVESISERAILVDGLHNVQIYFLGGAHTRGDLIVYLASDNILFAGDIAVNGVLPFMQSPDVDPTGWERALAILLKLSPERMVPGHGAIGPVTGIAESLAYVRRVDEISRKIADHGIRDEMLDAEIRAPENQVKNLVTSDAHIANVKALVKGRREKAARKPSPAAIPAPTPARSPAAQ
jgi:cyclase